MDNYELGQDVVDLADFQPRRVRLQATRTEIPVKAATPADEELARLSRERAVQTQISQQTESVRQPTDLDIQNDINRLSNQRSQVSSSDLPMATTARPQSPQQTADIVPKMKYLKALHQPKAIRQRQNRNKDGQGYPMSNEYAKQILNALKGRQ